MQAKKQLNYHLSLRRKERGAALLEFAISFPFYMLLVLGIIELLYYNYQYVNAQHLVSQIAENLAKGRLTDDNGTHVDLSPSSNPNQVFDINLIRGHAKFLAKQAGSDFGTASVTETYLNSRIAANMAARTNARFASDTLNDTSDLTFNAANDTVSSPKNIYGNISVCAIGSGNRCGWVDADSDIGRAGLTALQGQAIPPEGYPVSVSIRYPHRPLAMFFLSAIIGYLPIQADAIIRMEPTARPNNGAVAIML